MLRTGVHFAGACLNNGFTLSFVLLVRGNRNNSRQHEAKKNIFKNDTIIKKKICDLFIYFISMIKCSKSIIS